MAEGIYDAAARQARIDAEAFLRDEYALDLRITGFVPGVGDALWPKETFSWHDIIAHAFGPATLEIAVWLDGVLEIVAVCTGHGVGVILRHVEGRPAGNPALKGQRLWIILEAAANFATGLGKTELWWHPESDGFLRFCVQTIGARQVGRQCKLDIPG